MFEEKTVFILGAGASWHYGYPTGENLIKEVIKFADNLAKNLEANPYSFDNIDILNTSKYPRDELIGDCKKISVRLKQTNALVIDYFLEQNEDLRRIGRFLIAYVLIEDEIFYHANQHNGMDRNKNIPGAKGFERQDWYRFIIYKLLSDIDIKNPSELYNKNNVSFITFNYDVSLEHRLYSALNQVSFLQSVPDCVKNFMEQEGRFIHVYGQIRPISEVQNVPKNFVHIDEWYNKKMHILNAASVASDSIRIIPDLKDGNSSALELTKKTIEDADKIYILGYGFDSQNNERIGLSCLTSGNTKPHKVKKIYFTNYEDKDSINKKINGLWEIYKDKGITPYYRGGPNLVECLNSSYGKIIYDRSTKDIYTALESDFDFM